MGASHVPDLYHVSEDPSILEFVPRMPPSGSSAGDLPVVWAVDDAHLHNYLLPRDCPRVTFYATPSSDRVDIEALIGWKMPPAVVAIERAWVERVQATTLYLYTMPSDEFEISDEGAGYWISRRVTIPLEKWSVSDCLSAIRKRHVEVRVLDSLWELWDRVVASTLQFSCIRMRNASPRIELRADLS